jgi:hypothetical protein
MIITTSIIIINICLIIHAAISIKRTNDMSKLSDRIRDLENEVARLKEQEGKNGIQNTDRD